MRSGITRLGSLFVMFPSWFLRTKEIVGRKTKSEGNASNKAQDIRLFLNSFGSISIHFLFHLIVILF